MSRADIQAGKASVTLGMNSEEFLRGVASAQRRLRELGASLQQLGTAMTAAGVAIATPMGLAIKRFADFDDQMRQVEAVASATPAEFQKLTDAAKQLGLTTSFSAAEVAGLMAELGRAGFNPQQIEAATGAVLDMARASGVDAARAAEVMGSALNQFGIDAAQAGRVADALAMTANISATGVNDLGEALSYSGKVAADANMSIEDTLAILGALGNVGIKGSSAGTALQRLLTITGAEAEKLQGIFGVAFTDSANNTRPLVDVLAEVAAATKDMPTAERTAKMAEAFGLLGITGAGAIGQAADQIREFQKRLADSEGSSAKAAEKMDAGPGGAFRRMRNAIDAAVMSLGESLTPTLNRYGDLVQATAKATIAWIEANQSTVVGVAKIAAGLGIAGGSMVVFGAAAKAVSFALGGVTAVVSPVAAMLGTIGNRVRAITAPLNAVAPAFSRFGAAAISSAGQVSLGLARIIGGTGQIGAMVASGFVRLGISAGTSFASSLAATVSTATSTAWQGLQRSATSALSVIRNSAAAFGRGFTGEIGFFTSRTASMFWQFGERARTVFDRVVPASIVKMASNVSTTLGTAFAAVQSRLQAVVPIASVAASRVRTAWMAIGAPVSRVLVTSLTGAFSRITAAGIASAGRIRSAFGMIGRGVAGAGRGLGGAAMGVAGLAGSLGGAVGGSLGAFATAVPGVMMLATAVGALLNPVTLVIGAIAGGVYYWARFTESGQQSLARLQAIIAPFVDIFRTTFGGISDAIATNDVSLAGRIFVAGLKAAIMTGMAELSAAMGETWGGALGMITAQLAAGDFAGAWGTAVEAMGAIWDGFASGVVSSMAVATKSVMDLWQKTTTAISTWMLDMAAKEGVVGASFRKLLGVDVKAEVERGRRLEAERQAKGLGGPAMDPMAEARKVIEDQLGSTADAVRNRVDQFAADAEGRAQESRDKLGEKKAAGQGFGGLAALGARQDLEELKKHAAEQRKAFEKAPTTEAGQEDGSGGGAAAGAPGAAGAITGPDINQAKTFGSFSAAALSANAGGQSPMQDVMKEQLKELRKQREKADELVRAIKEGNRQTAGLVLPFAFGR